MKALLTSLLLGLLPALAFAGATSSPPSWTYPGAADMAGMPIVVSSKVQFPNGVPILTAGVPADVVTLAIPAGITRWRILSGYVVAESLAGTTAGSSYTIFDTAGGGGFQMSAAGFPGPAAAMPSANSLSAISTATPAISPGISPTHTLVVRQVSNSANAGSLSFYVIIVPAN